jgi:transaldolase
MTTYKSPLHEMASTTKTDYWNDSCSIEELTYAVENGAVGATSNPTIVLDVLKKEMPLWKDRIFELIMDNPSWSEDQITWKLIEEMAVKAAAILYPVFERENGLKGRLSIQTNPVAYRDEKALVEQAIHFHKLAPNMQIKLPATSVGIKAMEEVTYHGVNINATVSFCIPQAIAVAEAVERGLKRREAEGKSVSDMSPVCTLMIGRMDDWIQVLMKRDGTLANPGVANWAGIACMKKAFAIYKEKGYRTRPLAAAYRNHLHWTELIGGDIVLTIPYGWQKKFNQSNFPIIEKFSDPVAPNIIDELVSRFPDFDRAYNPGKMTVEEFDTFGPTVRTMRAFISSYRELSGVIRDFMLPDPDKK